LGEIRLERANPTPLYLQLAENIRKLMAEGPIRKGTVLFREGLLSRGHGSGT
jgi:DNA-binding transcriptional regulator YhcF (GntR family)